MEKPLPPEKETSSSSETKNLKLLFPAQKVFILTFWKKKPKEKTTAEENQLLNEMLNLNDDFLNYLTLTQNLSINFIHL